MIKQLQIEMSRALSESPQAKAMRQMISTLQEDRYIRKPEQIETCTNYVILVEQLFNETLAALINAVVQNDAQSELLKTYKSMDDLEKEFNELLNHPKVKRLEIPQHRMAEYIELLERHEKEINELTETPTRIAE